MWITRNVLKGGMCPQGTISSAGQNRCGESRQLKDAENI